MDVVRKVLVTKNRCNGKWCVSCTCCDKDFSLASFYGAIWMADHHIYSRHRRCFP